MSPAIESSVGIVAYLALFAGAAISFLFINLLVGKFLRPKNPHPEKGEIYECGEPTIGSSFVQFDLRFYVVALLFIIFDVEVAFFFPWATVFGKSSHLMDERFVAVEQSAEGTPKLSADAIGLYQEFGIRNPQLINKVPESLAGIDPNLDATTKSKAIIRNGSRQLAMLSLIDIAAFFGVLMVGFAYVWKRGDLDWVRAVQEERANEASRTPQDAPESEAALSA